MSFHPPRSRLARGGFFVARKMLQAIDDLSVDLSRSTGRMAGLPAKYPNCLMEKSPGCAGVKLKLNLHFDHQMLLFQRDIPIDWGRRVPAAPESS